MERGKPTNATDYTQKKLCYRIPTAAQPECEFFQIPNSRTIRAWFGQLHPLFGLFYTSQSSFSMAGAITSLVAVGSKRSTTLP